MAPNSKGYGQITQKFELVWDFMPVLVTFKFGKDQIKTEGVSMETSFLPIISQWELSVLSTTVLKNLKATFPPSHWRYI